MQNKTSHAFGIVSFLLVGIFAFLSVFVFDRCCPNNWGVTTKILSSNLTIEWAIPVSVPILMSIGFFCYIASFFFISVPVTFFHKMIMNNKKYPNDLKLMCTDIDQRMEFFAPKNILKILDPSTHDCLVYLKIISQDQPSAVNMKFLFAQIMFAKSVGMAIIIFSIYIVTGLPLELFKAASLFFAVWTIMCLFYFGGLLFWRRMLYVSALIDFEQNTSDRNAP